MNACRELLFHLTISVVHVDIVQKIIEPITARPPLITSKVQIDVDTGA